MTCLYDPRPIDSPCYWSTEEYASLADCRELVAEQLDRQHGWNGSADDLIGNYYLAREYQLGASVQEIAEMIWEFDITWED